MFANLRTDKSRDLYPEITYHRAPHKAFLLLSVINLIAEGRISTEAAPKGACQTKRKVQIESVKLIAYRSFFLPSFFLTTRPFSQITRGVLVWIAIFRACFAALRNALPTFAMSSSRITFLVLFTVFLRRPQIPAHHPSCRRSPMYPPVPCTAAGNSSSRHHNVCESRPQVQHALPA